MKKASVLCFALDVNIKKKQESGHRLVKVDLRISNLKGIFSVMLITHVVVQQAKHKKYELLYSLRTYIRFFTVNVNFYNHHVHHLKKLTEPGRALEVYIFAYTKGGVLFKSVVLVVA